jgi:hypothetical protein
MFLNELIGCHPAAGTPWLYLGDFNLIYEARDKKTTTSTTEL